MDPEAGAPAPGRRGDAVFTENGLLIDLDEVRKVVDRCDVFTIGFRLFPQRLIVDTRTLEDEGPMVEVVEPVGTVEERFFWLGKRRPRFGVPQSFTFFVWPHSVEFFVHCGLQDRIAQRLGVESRPEAAQALARVMDELRELERQAVRDALSGRNYHTVWPRK